ncbi:MAG: lytic transglycosylase domain-containing protein [Proteobacteria bacterium]|nr:lytic transglycosylase domain-containing protein [Pseudomonadota bacterium]
MKKFIAAILLLSAFYSLSFVDFADAACSGQTYCKINENDAGKTEVIDIIQALAPQYGVPTWFALRIADIESDFNRKARGSAGEYGVYQLKCSTAEQIGFRGDCKQLLNAWTNVRFGLKHLRIAIQRSRGDLRMAASKHNGGLARRTLVKEYVARVF